MSTAAAAGVAMAAAVEVTLTLEVLAMVVLEIFAVSLMLFVAVCGGPGSSDHCYSLCCSFFLTIGQLLK